MYEVAIVGAGPAGLAAAMYCIRKGVDLQLVAPTLGGKTTATVNFPDMTEYHVIKAREQVHVFRGRIEYLDHTYRLAHVTEIVDQRDHFLIRLHQHKGDAYDSIQAETLIVATGARGEYINVPGERKFAGLGVGTSAISYTHALPDRDVFMVGNSDRVIEAAIEAAQHARTVHLVIEPHADYTHHYLELADRLESITVYNGYHVRGFAGEEFAREVEIQRGAAEPRTIQADAFFLEREPEPNSALVRHLVECDDRGYIKIDEKNSTSHPLIFAAGDVTTVGIEQILIALGEGARAGLSAYRAVTAGKLS